MQKVFRRNQRKMLKILSVGRDLSGQISVEQFLNDPSSLSYSWIGRPVQTHTKIICHETKRATTDLNIRTKSSQRGASNGAG